MSKDRTIATDALETLGLSCPAGSGRDAIHLAVEPSVAAGYLAPGQHVGRLPDGRFSGNVQPTLGIVDPFLNMPVAPGHSFWLVIYPRQITSLRHVWSHPDFPEAAAAEYHADADDHYVATDKAASEQWIKDYAADRERCEVSYFELMEKAEAFCRGDTGWSEEYLHFDGSGAHGEIEPEFWRHFEVVTGLKPIGEMPTFFSCSC